jgi:hypothetical protein
MACKTHKDLEDTIAKQNDKIYQLEKDKDLLRDEIQALNLVEQNHQALNGKLRVEIDQLKLDKIQAVEDVKKEADEKAMMNMVKKIHMIDKLEQEIKQLKKEAQDNLLHP